MSLSINLCSKSVAACFQDIFGSKNGFQGQNNVQNGSKQSGDVPRVFVKHPRGRGKLRRNKYMESPVRGPPARVRWQQQKQIVRVGGFVLAASYNGRLRGMNSRSF